ncbi:MAG: Ni/Fe-hydrogenase, b-type cytochrome subunit [Bacteroidetes bacterium]|nr:Ni/Fe-hydrogenase, b-type cytochrome subunit [Bacteroidota bacterium]
MLRKAEQLYRIYVWELPVRFFHWVTVITVGVLIVTGYLIGDPIVLQHGGNDASMSYWFGWVRFIHFVAAYVFLFNFIIRIYWGFVGNKYVHWRNFFPYRKKHLKNMLDVLTVDVFQFKHKDIESPAHNSIAYFTYFIVYLAFIFEIVTGFGLYAAMSHSWIAQSFSWIIPLMGGDLAARQWHHAIMWLLIVFTIFHVYLVFFHDYVDGSGVTTSMVGGWKFISRKKFHDLQKEEQQSNASST